VFHGGATVVTWRGTNQPFGVHSQRDFFEYRNRNPASSFSCSEGTIVVRIRTAIVIPKVSIDTEIPSPFAFGRGHAPVLNANGVLRPEPFEAQERSHALQFSFKFVFEGALARRVRFDIAELGLELSFRHGEVGPANHAVTPE
jgi:hypothetical protein